MVAVCGVSSLAAESVDGFVVEPESARLYLDMARKASLGSMPGDEEWDSLFSSAAYNAFLSHTGWDVQEFKSNVRNAFELAYDPARSAERDSVAASVQGIDSELPLYLSTAMSIRERLDDYSAWLDSLNIGNTVEEARQLALDLLPGRGAGLEPRTSPVYFIVWDLECRSLGSGIYLDLNTFLFDGPRVATEILAHEMHHFYTQPCFEANYSGDISDPAAEALVYNMMEGTADIINKKRMPLTSLAPYGKDMLEIYNADYFASPDVLRELDSVTCDYLDGKVSFEEYTDRALGCAHFGGHTTGDYMVFMIRDNLGLESVVESYGDIAGFVDNYNRAVAKGDGYRFSDRFVNHIREIDSAARRK